MKWNMTYGITEHEIEFTAKIKLYHRGARWCFRSEVYSFSRMVYSIFMENVFWYDHNCYANVSVYCLEMTTQIYCAPDRSDWFQHADGNDSIILAYCELTNIWPKGNDIEYYDDDEAQDFGISRASAMGILQSSAKLLMYKCLMLISTSYTKMRSWPHLEYQDTISYLKQHFPVKFISTI